MVRPERPGAADQGDQGDVRAPSSSRTSRAATCSPSPRTPPSTRTPTSARRAPSSSNVAFSDVFEPGSTSKIMTMAAALEEGTVTPSTPVVIPNRLPRYDANFKDSHEHPTLYRTVAGTLAESSNIGTILVSETMKPKTLESYFRKFGLGALSGTGYPGESRGLLEPVEDVERHQEGHGRLRPGHLGHRHPGRLGLPDHRQRRGARRPSPRRQRHRGRRHRDPDPEVGLDPGRVAPDRLRRLAGCSRASSSPDGTAEEAQIPGYRVAGKTGTADYYDARAGGYSGRTASFIGYAPADDPQIVVAVIIQKPTYPFFGGYVAGPVFKDVTTYALQELKIPPTGAEAARDHPQGLAEGGAGRPHRAAQRSQAQRPVGSFDVAVPRPTQLRSSSIRDLAALVGAERHRIRGGRDRGDPRLASRAPRGPVRRPARRPRPRCRLRRPGRDRRCRGGAHRPRRAPTGWRRPASPSRSVVVEDPARRARDGVGARPRHRAPRAAPGRHHRHQRQDDDRLPRGLRPHRAGPAPGPDRHRRDPDRRGAAGQRAHHARGARAARRARRDGRAGAATPASWRSPATRWRCTGSTASSTTSRSSPTSRRTTSTSTTTWTTTSPPRPRCSPPSGPGTGWSASTTTWGRRLVERAGIPVSTIGVAADADWRIHVDGADPAVVPTDRTGGRPPPEVESAGRLQRHQHGDGRGRPGAARRGRRRPWAGRCSPTPTCPAGWRPSAAPEGVAAPRAVVDYAHTPEAIRAALRALRPTTPGSLVVRHRCRRRPRPRQAAAMGAAAAEVADLVVVTDDNPRSEDPAAIRAADPRRASRPRASAGRDLDVLDGGRPPRRDPRRPSTPCGARARPRRSPSSARATRAARTSAGVVHPFDDRAELARGAAPRRRDGRRVIALTLPEVARGDRWHGRRAARRRPGRPSSSTVRSSPTRASPARAGCSSPAAASTPTATTSWPAPSSAAPSPRWSTRPVDGVPCVVVADTQEAFAALAREVVRRLPGLAVVGITGSSGKTTTKDLLGTVLATAGPTVAPVGSFNYEIGVPLTVCGSPPTPASSSSRWGRAASGTSSTSPGWRRPRSGSCSTSARPTSASSARARRSPPPRPSSSAALPPDGLAVLNADDPAVRAMAAVTARPGRARRGGRRRRRPRRPTSSLDDGWPGLVHRAHAAGEPRRAPRAGRAPPRRQRARRGRGRGRARHVPRVGLRRAGVRAPGQPVADGGRRAGRRRHRSSTTPTTPTPTRCAPPSRRWSGWGRGGAPGRCSARCSSSATSPTTLHAEVGRRGRRPGRRRARRRRRRRRGAGGRAHARWARHPAPAAPGSGRCRTPTPRPRCSRPSCAAGDVVLVKSSRDAGLRLLGDRLAGPREELT